MDVTGSAPRHALSTLAAIVVAPGEAFCALRERPVWMWALAFTIVFASVGALLGTPASRHVIEISLPGQLASDPRLAGVAPEEARTRIEQIVAVSMVWVNLGWLMYAVLAPFVTAFEAGLVFAVRAIVRNSTPFAKVFALVAHVQFIGFGLYTLVLGAIAALRPVDSFRTQIDYYAAVPSLAWLAPAGPLKLVAFLAALHPFALWATAILALGLVEVAGMKRGVSWTTALIILLASAAWAAAFIR